MAKKNKVEFDKIPSPKLQEISFEGNMPSTYEKNLKKVLAKQPKTIRRKK